MSNLSHSASTAFIVGAMFVLTPLLTVAVMLFLYALPIYLIGYALVSLHFIASMSFLTAFKLGLALFAGHWLWKLVRG